MEPNFWTVGPQDCGPSFFKRVYDLEERARHVAERNLITVGYQ